MAKKQPEAPAAPVYARPLIDDAPITVQRHFASKAHDDIATAVSWLIGQGYYITPERVAAEFQPITRKYEELRKTNPGEAGYFKLANGDKFASEGRALTKVTGLRKWATTTSRETDQALEKAKAELEAKYQEEYVAARTQELIANDERDRQVALTNRARVDYERKQRDMAAAEKEARERAARRAAGLLD